MEEGEKGTVRCASMISPPFMGRCTRKQRGKDISGISNADRLGSKLLELPRGLDPL